MCALSTYVHVHVYVIVLSRYHWLVYIAPAFFWCIHVYMYIHACVSMCHMPCSVTCTLTVVHFSPPPPPPPPPPNQREVEWCSATTDNEQSAGEVVTHLTPHQLTLITISELFTTCTCICSLVNRTVFFRKRAYAQRKGSLSPCMHVPGKIQSSSRD